MFSKQQDHVLADLSTDLRDEQDWKVGSLRTLEFPLDITAFAVEPISGLLAVGTHAGLIYIFGGPGVESKLTIPHSVGVRFLHFAVSTYNIVCLDNNNEFHVWNLMEFGRPKLVTSARFDQTNSITLSPSHTHVFLATQKGEIRTYDLTCLRKSPYIMPNMWKLYEEKMAASGIPVLALPTPPACVDTVVHPRNLNLMFVAYAGGIILTDLTEKSTVRAYELILPPGAPGGAGYGFNDILTHRRSTVTCLTVHPSGHYFAVGYADGSFAFWAVEDDNRPLLVRTLDSVDVNLVDASILESHLSKEMKDDSRQLIREPIFKLSWSSFPNSADQRGGDTTLTVLGGLDPGKPPGLTVMLLPAFNPSEPPAEPPAPQDALHPYFRSAMVESLNPIKCFYYETQGIVQDHILMPRSSPHLGGNHAPYAILMIIESAKNARTLEARQFPPPGFIKIVQEPPKTVVQEDDEEAEESFPAGLQSPPPPTPPPKSPRYVNHTPLPLRMPFALSLAASGLLGGHIFKLENDVYEDFVDKKISIDLQLELKGGMAYSDSTKLNELKLSKYQPHRALVTYNRDLSVQFFDMSAQLLIPTGSTPLENDFPKPLPGLTIRLDELLDDPAITERLLSSIDSLAIQSVQVAPEALECAIALKSGEVIVYHASTNRTGDPSPKINGGTEIVLLEHIYTRPGRRLVPYFMLSAGRGAIEAYAMSDIGFLAVSYRDGSLLIIDMRGPKILVSLGANKRPKTLPRPHVPLRGSAAGTTPSNSGPDLVKSLTWTVSCLEKDSQQSVRLIAAYQSGHAEVHTLMHSGNPVSWTVFGEPAPCKAMGDSLPDGIFVLDSKTGAQWKADRARLAASYKGTLKGVAGPQCVMVTVGAKGARCSHNLNGEKVGKVEWGHKVGAVQSAQIVERMGAHVLVVQTEHHDALVYSLPHLEYLHTVQLPPVSSLPLTIDKSGDFIAWTLHSRAEVIFSATYGTFFDIRRVYTPPDIDFTSTRKPVPAQPQPVSMGPASYLGSWFSFNQTSTGDQIDELLGGPNRPIPEKVQSERGATSEEGAGMAGTAAGAAASLAAGAAAVQANLYNKLTSAMNERGQMLGDLEERFNSLEEGSRSMVAQAKRLAAQQTAKGWFGF
ncbi:WD40 containing snare-dependent exocytosis protein [Crassisporium funariophilum]|nr:WD40 containing snare-dependent exocytosis protein [Crassisporium funariophilum]